jgi:hypothetical protein
MRKSLTAAKVEASQAESIAQAVGATGPVLILPGALNNVDATLQRRATRAVANSSANSEETKALTREAEEAAEAIIDAASKETPRNINELLPPAEINLADTAADRGDRVQIETTLSLLPPPRTAGAGPADGDPPAEQPAPTLLGSNTETLTVDRFGLVGDFSAGVIFVNRSGEGDADDGSGSNFVPAASASYVVHYRIREEQDDPVGTVWRVLDPGIGVAIAVLPFDNETEIGLGGELTFFDNLLHVGYGYAVTAGDDQDYWYIGLGILETLAKVGDLAAGRSDLIKGSEK